MTKSVIQELLVVVVVFVCMCCASTTAYSDGDCSDASASSACPKSGKSMLQTSSFSAAFHSERQSDLVTVQDAELQNADPKERQQATAWLKSMFPLTSAPDAANYATSLLNLDAWIAAGRYNSSLFTSVHLPSNLQAWSKTIHQTWKNETLDRELFKESQLSWKTTFPSWQYRLWTDGEMMPFMQAHYPDFSDMFRMFPFSIMKVDAFRLFILHHYGGIYADLDFLALQNFEALLETYTDKEVVVGEISESADANQIPNALMVSKPRARLWEFMHGLLPIVLHTACLRNGHDKISSQHSYWKTLESHIDRLSQSLIGGVVGVCHVESVTGPILLTSAIKHSVFNNQSVAVVDGVKFYPIDWSTEEGQKQRYDFHVMAPELVRQELQKRFPDSVTATIWTHSWGYNS